MPLLFVRKGHNIHLALVCLLVWIVTAYGTESLPVTRDREHALAASADVRKAWSCASSPSVCTFSAQCFGREVNGLCWVTQSAFFCGWDADAPGATMGKRGFGFVNSNICVAKGKQSSDTRSVLPACVYPLLLMTRLKRNFRRRDV
jgi:hypothetical protein